MASRNNLPLKETDPARHAGAFTRVELLAVLAALVLVAGVVLPALAQGKPRSQQAICFNNLRVVGQAVLMFNEENGQTDPWRTTGAGYDHPLRANLWFQFSLLSNGLSTPKVLACPSDKTRPARDFSLSPDGGFLHSNYRDGAISYFAGMDSSPLMPGSVLAGDRNIQYQGFSQCSVPIGPLPVIYTFPFASTSWGNGLHEKAGNVLLHDGRVEQASGSSIGRLFMLSDDNGSVHLMLPSILP